MFRRILVAVLVCLPLIAPASDLKYSKKIKDGAGEHGEMTLYFQGQRLRIDHRNEVGYGWKDDHPENIYYGPRTATIFQCDMRRVLQLDFDHHQYTVTNLDRSGFPVNADGARLDPPQPRRSGVKVKVVVETRETGETRQMFGYTARRFITTRKEEPAPGSCGNGSEVVDDGWYLDIEPPQDGCMQNARPQAGARVVIITADSCVDEQELQHTGPQPPPFAVELTTTSKTNGTSRNSTTAVMVTDLSRLPLDPQVFELPTGYKHVDNLDESPNLPYLLRAKLMWQSVKTTVWGWTPWGK